MATTNNTPDLENAIAFSEKLAAFKKASEALEENKSKVEIAIAAMNVQEEQAIALRTFFEPLEQQANEWKEKAFALVVTDASQTDLMQDAKEARLLIRQIRLNIEKLHKSKKEASLREGQTLDMIKRTLVSFIEPMEEHLQLQEDFLEIQEKERIAKLRAERIEILRPYVLDDSFLNFAFEDLDEDAFQNFLNSQMAGHEAREKKKADEAIEAAKAKVWSERSFRISRLGFRANEDKSYTHEGIKSVIKKDWIDSVDAVAFEVEMGTLAAKIVKWDKAEAKRKADDQKAKDDAKKLKKAPDAEKLTAMADRIYNLKLEFEGLGMEEKEAAKIQKNAADLLQKVVKYIKDNAAKL